MCVEEGGLEEEAVMDIVGIGRGWLMGVNRQEQRERGEQRWSERRVKKDGDKWSQREVVSSAMLTGASV